MPRGVPKAANSSSILLTEVLAAWEYVEDEHGVKLECTLQRIAQGSPGQLQASLRVVEGAELTAAELDINARWAWPTVHHKTFLGMMMWLIHQVDSEVTAQRCLAGVPQFPPSSP